MPVLLTELTYSRRCQAPTIFCCKRSQCNHHLPHSNMRWVHTITTTNYHSATEQNMSRLIISLTALAYAVAGFSPVTNHAFSSFTSPSTTTALSMAIDEAMLGRLEGIRRSYNALTERLADPDVIADSNLLRQVMSDRAQSEDVVLAFDEYSQLLEELEGAKELLQDPDMKDMAREEIKEIEPKMEELEQKITILLLPKDPNDGRNVMLEIRAGTGGSEANIFAGDLLDVYRKYIQSQGWQCTMIDSTNGDDGGYKNVVLDVKGDSVYSKLKWEAGVHRVQRVPATESQGRVHTSTATVAIMPECDEVDVKIDPKDIEMSTMRSGGAGGQNVNKVRKEFSSFSFRQSKRICADDGCYLGI